jgi:hypothetical protein
MVEISPANPADFTSKTRPARREGKGDVSLMRQGK